jgi:hypothetical protein
VTAHTVRKVDVVKRNPRTTETVGDDGTVDPDFLRMPRREKVDLGRKPFLSLSFMSEEQWSLIFNGQRDDVASQYEGGS